MQDLRNAQHSAKKHKPESSKSSVSSKSRSEATSAESDASSTKSTKSSSPISPASSRVDLKADVKAEEALGSHVSDQYSEAFDELSVTSSHKTTSDSKVSPPEKAKKSP